MHDAVKSIDVIDPTSELGRFEDKVRRQEALAAGKQELAASSLDAQFNELEDVGELTEVEARLAALKSGGTAGARSTRRAHRTRRTRLLEGVASIGCGALVAAWDAACHRR